MNSKSDRQDFEEVLSAISERELNDWERERLWELLTEHPEWMEEYTAQCFLEADMASITAEELVDAGIQRPVSNVVAISDSVSSAPRAKVGRFALVAALAVTVVVLGLVFRSQNDGLSPLNPGVAKKEMDSQSEETVYATREVVNRKEGLSLDDPNDEAVSLSGPAALANSRTPRGGKPEGAVSVPEEISFNHHVRPILSENCFFCHGPDENTQEAGLRLDTMEGATEDLGGYAAITPGDVEKSEVWARIISDDPDDLMPPPESHRELSAADREILRRWIEGGAEYDPHWAFITPERPEVPEKANDWIRNSIDAFLLPRMEEEGLSPNPEAEPRVLLRRLSLDLIGLPPTPAELAAFEKAYLETPDRAYNAAVSRLLDSPHFGEKMALAWLDAARYGDSNGFQQDGNRHQWPWRDWVVRAYNENKPFDEFTIEQLAGDLLENPGQDQIVATAFNRNHMLNGEGGAIKEEQRINYVIDRVDTTSTTWLGLTMACAQCHTHKYDPITHEEYFQFFAFFNNIPESGGVDKRSGRGCAFGSGATVQLSRPWLDLPTDKQIAEQKRLGDEIKSLESEITALLPELDPSRKQWETTFSDAELVDKTRFPGNISGSLRTEEEKRNAGQKREITEFYLLQEKHHEKPDWKKKGEQIKKLRADLRHVSESIVQVMVMEENAPDKKRETFLLNRGDYQQPAQRVTEGTPAFLPPMKEELPRNRLGLAKWLVDPEHPLTARVAVNRLWQQFFGIGIVKTSEDLGVQGELPVHPELLDWLAVEFVESGWDVKHIIRLIVSSSAYRQTSEFVDEKHERDPENRFVARGSRARLPSMVLRDQALAVSGLLIPEVGGAPVYPHQPEGMWKDFSFGKISYPHTDNPEQLHRRSLYTFWRRTSAPPNMFDSSSRQVCTVKPSTTNTPLQALTLMNDITYVEAARALAERMSEEGGETVSSKLSYAFELATGRLPDETEARLLKSGYDRSLNEFQSFEGEAALYVAKEKAEETIELAALTRMAQVILNLDETLNRP